MLGMRGRLSRDFAAEAALAMVWMALGIVMLVGARSIALISVTDPLGPRLVPRIEGVTLIVLGLAVILRHGLRGSGDTPESESEPAEAVEAAEAIVTKATVASSSGARVVLTLVMAAAYITLIPLIGYLLATGLFTFVLTWSLRSTERWWRLLLWAVFLALGVYWVFTSALHVSLPTGSIF